MKTLNNSNRLLITILVGLIFFQSCSVYRQPTTLENTVKAPTKTKIKTKDGQKLKYKSIVFENGRYYGMKKVQGELVRIDIDEQDIETVRLKNREVSTFMSILLFGVLCALTPAIAFATGGGV
ncbi:hypothetical protein [Seonamhaeicola sp. ML3]|uniref:hypothetical protein n=1 Tax=Seonamhaeicola sp. ML3 TaxID=2937786 RepID=UPI00200ED668|nr:hypothetical protein [Seonamhaeicola sp. ML3]